MKLYADETGSEFIRGLESIIVSLLARVEVPSALWRKERDGQIALETVSRLIPEFEVDVRGRPDQPPRFSVVPVGVPIADRAARLCATDPLRAYDAIQLATVLTLTGTVERFACFDSALRDAAARRGVPLVPDAV